MGIWDRLFGRKSTHEVANEIEKVQKPPITVIVNFFDPKGGLSDVEFGEALFGMADFPASPIFKKTWTVGKEISQEHYSRFKSPRNGEIHVLVSYKEGKRQMMIVSHDFWDSTMSTLEKQELF